MARQARLAPAGYPLHVVHRGHDRCPCFDSDADRSRYLEKLEIAARTTGCRVHAYVLMTNHVHLLATGDTDGAVSRLMKRVSQNHAQYMNWIRGRSGALWEGRFHSGLIARDEYPLACYRYVELNPVRAKMVAHPGEYPWSSYRANAEGTATSLIAPHDAYLAMAPTPHERQRAYRTLFEQELPAHTLAEIRSMTFGNPAIAGPVGSDPIQGELGSDPI